MLHGAADHHCPVWLQAVDLVDRADRPPEPGLNQSVRDLLRDLSRRGMRACVSDEDGQSVILCTCAPEI